MMIMLPRGQRGAASTPGPASNDAEGLVGGGAGPAIHRPRLSEDGDQPWATTKPLPSPAGVGAGDGAGGDGDGGRW